MRTKLTAVILMIFMLITLFCGCNNDTTDGIETTTAGTAEKNTLDAESVDYNDVYSDILADFTSLFDNTDADYEGTTGVIEIINMRGRNEALDCIGYTIRDLNGDKIPEFIVGFIDDAGKGSEILALYTYKDNSPVFVLESTTRSAYFLMNDGNLFYQGSAGAMYSIFASYALSEKAELVCNDYWFTYEKDKTSYEIGYYHNTTGDFDKAVSEELNISEDEFFKKQSDLISEKAVIELTPFSTLAEKELTTVAEDSRVVAMFSVDAGAFDEYAVFTVDESEYSTKLLFMAEGTVTDFNFLSLLITDVDENGNMTFDSQSLYSSDVLTEDKPLEVTLTFYGDTPAYGISYKDAQGITKNYTVTISGEDGSLILSEY
ncbi:MAG: hypothetical protein J6V06_03440 [Clostridia bacterium]|nr:hypothetical protein [Clostridia bacterium]